MEGVRTCTRCQVSKSLDAFGGKGGGLRKAQCKACCAERDRQYAASNRERMRAKNKNYRLRNSEQEKERHRAWRVKDPAGVLASDKRRREKASEKRAADAAYWRAKNPERVKSNYAKWHASNKHKVQAKNARRRALEKKATPAWADKSLVNDIYAYAQIMREHGVDCHVDHIVPLRGRTVCGLHAHTNLTVLLAEDNMRKHNKLIGV